ncbi:hypothetical protein J3E64_002488 [Sphingobium sp. OAS761]|uniref:L,D-transpeptidase family protein n=1 Tax=Sphingobium sp. OAS761 TaxID=2817901 RepID=UPI00209D7F7A|nr:L,D-transpeptidase family protein [Sphingobium sp. OAS761]MCP1470795.1 hypothetical protein [Sphingobium sp. OAS761]
MIRPFLTLLALLSLPSAAVRAQADAAPLAPGAYRWLAGAPPGGAVYMVISIEKQMIHVYSGDRLIGMASVSTGMKGHRTPTGEYPILQKNKWHRSNLYSNAPMPFMQRLTWDGIALHAGHNPGYPASHGCIRLPYAFARQLFAMTKLGTLVQVAPARLSVALALDPLVVADPGSTVVTFGTDPAGTNPAPARFTPMRGAPRLEIDESVFAMRAGH